MKRNFSCLIMVVMVFLFGASERIEAAAFAGSAAAKAVAREAAEAGINRIMATKLIASGLDDFAAKTFMKSVGSEALEKIVLSGGDDVLARAAGAASKAVLGVGDDLAKVMSNMGKSAQAIEKMGGNFALMGDDVVSKIGTKDFSTILASGNGSSAFKAFKEIGVKGSQLTKLTSLATASAGALDDVAGLVARNADNVVINPMHAKVVAGSVDDIGVGLSAKSQVRVGAGALDDVAARGGTGLQKTAGFFDNAVPLSADDIALQQADELASGIPKASNSLISNPLKKTGLRDLEFAELQEVKLIAKTGKNAQGQAVTAAEKSAATHRVAELEFKGTTSYIGRFGRNIPAYAWDVMKYGGGTMAAAVLFMIPSIFQSAFMAQQQKNAMLQTYIPPTKFGNIVMQLPDSVVNTENPAMSQFIYYGIPVSNPGEKLSSQAKAMYKGVSNPTNDNKISKALDNSYAMAFTGATKKLHVPRYNLDANALSTLPVFVSYTDQSWSEWAVNGIPDAAFTQTMINLDTGYIFYADGSSQGTMPATLVGPGTNGKTVQSFLAKEYGILKNTGSQRTYTEYVDTASSSKSNKVGSPVAERFNCGCLENNGGVLSADTLQTCATAQSSSCLLTGALNQLAAGLVINSQGTIMTPDQDMDEEIAQGALGQVIPIQGYGDKFDDILQMFPGAEQDAIANSGVLTISLGTNISEATPIQIQGAQADNYSAKGIYIYQCQNTPLAKMLKSQAGGNASTVYNSLITDYIVFLDQNLNQIPMMTPIQDPNNYNFITMGLNPAIKYVSSIIGNFDGNGSFNFLPQLNIQAPAALVAKGLPASFPPLYGLNAKNGTLAVNYNQNLTSVIGTIVQSLGANPKLGQQFKNLQAAMLRLLSSGPFGKYRLSPVDEAMQPVIGGVNLVLYTGFNGYPVSQDSSNSACTDLLIPLSAQGKTIVLPSNNVAEYYGLVTDLTYTVKSDGTIVVADDGFENSPLLQSGSSAAKNISWSIDQAKASQFYWMSKLTSMGEQSDPNFEMPSALLDFVMEARSAWIEWVQSSSSHQMTAQEFSGTMVAGTSNVLTIASQQAIDNGLYLYTCSPNPSPVMQDFFVLTNSSRASLTDPKLGKMSATTATAATNMLSLITGQLYGSSGNLVGSAAVDPKQLMQSLYKLNPQSFSNDLKAQLNTAYSQSNSASQAIAYPFMFGSLQLGIYQADLTANNYLYLNAAGAGTSVDFLPSDYLVCVDSYANPSAVGTKLSSTTPYMISLVSGQVYSPNGPVDFAASNVVSKIVSSLSPQWRAGQIQQIAALASQRATTQQYQQQQTAQMAAAPVAHSGAVTWAQSSVATVIAGLASQSFLQPPYDVLKQDPTSRMYVAVMPADQDETQMIYIFFDVPNSFLDAAGNAMHVGAMYDSSGNLLYVVQDAELAALLQQYGISIDSSGKQSLGAMNLLSMMQLDPADRALRPGVSGRSMIYSNDASFPSQGIVSPIVYQDSKFYIYYNTISKSYFAMQVTPSNSSYIDMASGNVYQLNGQSQIVSNPVAVNASNSADLFLPYVDSDNFISCVMKNSDSYTDFLNLTDSFQPTVQDPATGTLCGLNQLVSLDASATNVQIAQMPFSANLTAMPDLSVTNQYNVYRSQSTAPDMYKVTNMYQWQNLQLLPINMQTGAMLNPLPAAIYKSVRLIMKGNAPFACIFANQFFSNPQQAGKNAFTMSSGATSITGSLLVDTKTNVPYISIVANGVTYNYQYTFLTLSDDQLENYQQNVWKAQTVADITGKVILAESLAVNKLTQVNMKSVINAPIDAASQAVLNSNLSSILHDVENGRFIVKLTASMYPYFTQNGFVDLANGVLFDASGNMLGGTLQAADLVVLLQKLAISVQKNISTGQVALMHRASATALSGEMMQADMGSAPMPALNSNPAIAALQEQNAQAQADMSQRQARLAKVTGTGPSVTSQKAALKNAIARDKQQIAANNKQILALANSSAPAGRSGLLGRLGSKIFKKKNRKK